MKRAINETEAAPQLEEMQDNTEAAFLLEHEYSSIEDIFQMLGQCRNEEYKATAQRILHRGLSLLREILSYHSENEQVCLLLQRAETGMDHLSRLAAALEEGRRQNLRELFVHQRQALTPPHELIRQQERSRNPRVFHRTNRGSGQESANVFFRYLKPDLPGSILSKESRKIPKPFCKSESSITLANFSLAGFPLSSSTSITVTADNVSPDGGK